MWIYFYSFSEASVFHEGGGGREVRKREGGKGRKRIKEGGREEGERGRGRMKEERERERGREGTGKGRKGRKRATKTKPALNMFCTVSHRWRCFLTLNKFICNKTFLVPG